MHFLILAFAAAQSAAVGVPAFDPRRHKQEITGRAAEVLVLGTPHLSGLPKSFDPKLLDSLIDRLARFRPDIVTIEALSGEECDTLRRFKTQHGANTLANYCSPTDDIEKETGLTVYDAAAQADQALAALPPSPTAGQRRHLAMLFLAASDRASATVQWLRLPPRDRQAGDGLTPVMVDTIERRGKPLNENYAIAAVLAARLGLERVYPVDDHTADAAIDENSPSGREYNQAIEHAWRDKPPPLVRTQEERLEQNLQRPADVLSLYRLVNDPANQRETIAADMGRNALYRTPQLYGRRYLSWWETRNLRIAANIRSTLRLNPQARVLSIIGATHKGYLDAYLDMMQDVTVLDAMQFLR